MGRGLPPSRAAGTGRCRCPVCSGTARTGFSTSPIRRADRTLHPGPTSAPAGLIWRLEEASEQIVKGIRRATRRRYSAEEKIRIVLDGLRGEHSIAELCRREGIAQNLYYRWSKDFLEAGKKRLAGDTARAATSDEVKDLRREATALKEVVADLTLENRLLKKSVTADGEDEA